MIADLDTLLTALYVELTDRIIPARDPGRRGPGKPPELTDGELVCLAGAQVLLRFDDERHWLRAAPRLVGHLFPRLLRQSEYNDRLKAAAPLMEAALRWLAEATPGSAEMLRLMDATPIPCGTSALTARRSDLFGYAGYGYCPRHSRWYWGCKLLLICTCDGTVTGFGLANPKLFGEREQARQLLNGQPANRPAPGTAVVTDKGLSGAETEAFFAGPDLHLALLRPARSDEKPRPFPNWLRQRVEAVIWMLKDQLGLERHGGRVPAGLWARIVQRLLAHIVYTTSADGITWSPVTRIPIDPVGSGTDHFIPGLAVNPATSGAHTQLALTYYFDTDPSCSGSTCQIQAGFTSSLNNGATWSTPVTLSAPMQLGWLAPTSQGVMVGDYISTSFLAGEQRVIGVFAAASAPGTDGMLNQPMFAALENVRPSTIKAASTRRPAPATPTR